MRNVLVLIGTPLADTPFQEWLGQHEEVTLHIFTSSIVAEQYRSVFAQVKSYENYERNGNVELDAILLGKSILIDAVYSRSEVDVDRAARIRSALGIAGLLPEVTALFRNKFLMKENARQKSIPVPYYQRCDQAIMLYRFVVEHQFPVVVKPLDASGSTGVEVLKSFADLTVYLEQNDISREPVLVESFVTGKMFHADCLVVCDKLRLISISRYINDCLNYKFDNTFIGSVILDSDNPELPKMLSFTKEVISAFPSIADGVYHLEFWKTPQGSLVFCEVACRPCGGRVPQQINEAFSLNIDKEYFLAECKCTPAVDDEEVINHNVSAGHLTIYPKKGKLVGMPLQSPLNETIKEYRVLGKIGQQYFGGEKSGRGIASIVVKSGSEQEVEQLIFQEYLNFDRGCAWENN